MDAKTIETAEAGLPEVVGASIWASVARKAVARLAQSAESVLLCGPVGTGKRQLGRAIHARSPRAGREFAVVDCDAPAGPAMLRRLFGQTDAPRGALAVNTFGGCIAAADGGTVFFREVNRLDLAAQSGLLRLLEEGTVVAEGSCEPVPVDVRVMASTSAALEREVAAGRFLRPCTRSSARS